MRISTDFGNAQQWSQTHFGGVGQGDVRRARQVVTLAAGWAREPGRRPPSCGCCATSAAAPPLDTVRAAYLALAARGGHRGRKRNGPLGWQTLWLGRRSLRLLVEGANMAAQLLDE